MDKVCFLCKQIFPPGSLKTPRSRFQIIGIIPPEGMGPTDKICNKCLHKIYDEQIKQDSVKQLKKNMVKDLLKHANKELHALPKNIETEKKKRFLQ
jgi:hypothetical protein